MNTLPSLSDGLKIFRCQRWIIAKPTQVRSWYYVPEPRMPGEARKRFKDRITWLDVYASVKLLTPH